MNKVQYRIKNIEKFALIAFQDYKNKALENSVKNMRISTEAICKATILDKKGEIQGEEILLGERNGYTFRVNSAHNKRKPDLNALIGICREHKYFSSTITKNEKVFHRFDDIRKIGNKGAHDPINQNNEITQEEVDFCYSIFKENLRWFYNDYLKKPIPQILKDGLAGKIENSLQAEFNHPVWNKLYEACDAFSKFQKFVLISPPNFRGLSENQLSLLCRVNWHFIFDFNPDSKENGLFASLYSQLSRKQLHPITIEQKGKEGLVNGSNLSINYVFANGLSGLQQTISTSAREWKRKKYADFINSLIKEYVETKIQPITLISLYDDINFAREIIESFDTNISNSDLLKIIILVQDRDNFSRIKEEFEDFPGEILELSASSFIEGISKSIIPEGNIYEGELYQIPAKNSEGQNELLDISEKYFSFTERALDVIYHGISESTQDTSSDIFSFYKGSPITWSDLANDVAVRRDRLSDLLSLINDNLRKTKGGYVIELFHRPGAGGSTLSKSIALQFYEQYPTVLINEYHKSRTSDALFELSTLSQKPILAIVEAHKVSQNNLNRLIRQINEDKKYVVIVYVKRSYTEPKLKPNLIFLSEKMVSISERNRFVSKFLQIAEKKNYNRIKQLENRHPANCDIIDFPLTTFENDYEVDSLDKYIISYLSKLPSSQLKFTCFTSLLYYYTQKNISEFWLTELFPQKSLRNELLQRPSSERYIEKVFLNELDDEFQETEFWRPKYNRFAVETLQLCIMGLDQARKANWKDHLHRWVVEFIKEIRNSNEYLTDDIRDILKSLILERDHEDLLGVDESYETRTSNRKFSRLLKDIAVKEKQISVFRELISAFPDESHFRGHYGRFLYEKAEDESEFEKAEDQINVALELGENDYNLWHLKGMCNRRRIEFILRSNIDEYSAEEIDDLELILQELTNEANESFLKSRELNPFNLYSHTAQIQVLIKVIEFGRRISKQSKEAFLLDSKNIWYENQLEEVFNLLDEAQYNIELSKDLERSKRLSQTKNMIEGCQGGVFQLLGDFSKAIDKFRQLSESSDRDIRPYYRKMYVYSTLAGKVDNNPKKFYLAWEKLGRYEYEGLIKALEDNIREQPDNPYHIKLWLQAVRYSKVYLSLDDCISIVKTWVDNSSKNEISNIEALYYLYVLNSCKAIEEGDSFSELTAKEAEKYLKLSSNISKNDRYSFEWYGKGQGVKRLVNHRQLGGMNSSKKFFDDDKERLLERVEGVVTNIYSRQSGKIKLICGLECFFVPFHARLEEGKDETTKVSFYIGFRQSGLTAWEVKRVEKLETSIMPEIESNEYDLDGNDYLEDDDSKIPLGNDEITEKEEKGEALFSNTTQLKGLTIKGKIDLSQFEKYKKKKLK